MPQTLNDFSNLPDQVKETSMRTEVIIPIRSRYINSRLKIRQKEAITPRFCWLPKFYSTVEILFITAWAVFLPIHSSQSAQPARAEGEGPPPRLPSPGRWGGTSSVLASLGTQAEGEE